MNYPEREYIFPGSGVRLFRQAGGCLEITQDNTQVLVGIDIIHVCSHDVDGFVRDLTETLPDFVKNTPPMH